MIYRFECDEITKCGECPCFSYDSECLIRMIQVNYLEKPADCPLVDIPQMETVGCEWCENVGKYAQFDFATYTEVDGDKECEYVVKVIFCPNCGRKLKGE